MDQIKCAGWRRKKVFTLPETEPRLLSRQARRLVTTPTQSAWKK